MLESISIRHQMERYPVVYPEFHFHAIDGNVNAIHREILSTNSPTPLNFVSDARIDISAEKQRSGAVYVGGWHCGPEKYEVQLRAVLIDSTGNRSNPLEYHIDCSGL